MARKGENIYHRKDGRWEGRYKLTGDEKYRSVYAKTYRECKEKRLKMLKNCSAKTVKTGFEKLCSDWLSSKKNRVKESTSKRIDFISVNDKKSYSYKPTKAGTYGFYIVGRNPYGDTVSEYKQIKVHSYNSKIVPPTCTAKGYTEHVCSVCGNKYTDSITNATGHKFGAWSVSKNATCTADGQQIRKCSICGKTETQSIPKTGHKYTNKVIAPTCTAKGYTEHVCSICGNKYTDSITNATGHKFGAWSVSKNATCTADGQQTRKCSICGKTETQTIAKTGHKYVNKVVAPTCTNKGYTEHVCSACGGKYVDNYTNALGHSFGEWTIEKQPTTSEKGVKVRKCTRCGQAEKTDLPMIVTTAPVQPVITTVTSLQTVPVLPKNNNSPTIKIANAIGRPGDKLGVNIRVSDNPGVIAMGLAVDYDTSKLRLVGVHNGRVMGNSAATFGNDLSSVPYRLCWDDLSYDDHTRNGVLVRLEFEILSDAPVSQTDIKLSMNDGSTFNAKLEDVYFDVVSGKVNIKQSISKGDIDGDNNVTISDASLIQRYLAGKDDAASDFAADVNGDGKINVFDMILIKRALLH